MNRTQVIIASAFAGGLILGAALVWIIRSPTEISGVRADAKTIYCAKSENQASLHKAMAALGPGTSYRRACDAMVELSDPALENSSDQPLTWQSILLGSSVLAALVTALFNVRSTTLADRRGRVTSLIEAAFTAYQSFNREAREYIGLMNTPQISRPPIDNLTGRHEDFITSLGRLPKHLTQKLTGSADQIYEQLYNCPTKSNSGTSDYLDTVGKELDELGTFMVALENDLFGESDAAVRSMP
jgi:hypothetical protein